MAHTFQQCFNFGHSRRVMRQARVVLREKFPTMLNVEPATPAEDRRGVDLWVTLRDGHRIAVDVKAQRNYQGCVPLEVWSVMEQRVRGWTLREDSITDFVLWVWPFFRKYVLVPFRPLQVAFRTYGRAWYNLFPVSRQYTPPYPARNRNGYHSMIVLVPLRTLSSAIADVRMMALAEP